ncbi:MAG: hypothetical protein ACRETF_04585 [Nevskiaceae bacterium]
MNTCLRYATGLGVALLLAPPVASAADWTLRVDAPWMNVGGHDQHALTVRNRDTSGTPAIDRSVAFDATVPSGLNFGLAVKRMDGGSGWGFDFIYFGATADKIRQTAAGSATNEVTFTASDQSYSSTAPGTVLYYDLREDNRLEVWTADAYYQRALAAGLELQLGVRFGDFDNDYRAVIGIENVEGTFFDNESNYPRMMGPLVGLGGTLGEGRSRIEGYLGQSLITGRASLRYSSQHFTGTPAAPTVDDRRFFSDYVQVAIPITELRLRYHYRLTERLTLSTGVSSQAWWDVPVPPGVTPDPNAGQTLQENTVVFYSVLASAEWRF